VADIEARFQEEWKFVGRAKDQEAYLFVRTEPDERPFPLYWVCGVDAFWGPRD
jgi:hypothetical protein